MIQSSTYGHTKMHFVPLEAVNKEAGMYTPSLVNY